MVNREAKPYTQEAFASTLFSFERALVSPNGSPLLVFHTTHD